MFLTVETQYPQEQILATEERGGAGGVLLQAQKTWVQVTCG